MNHEDEPSPDVGRSWDGRALPVLSARLDLMIGTEWPVPNGEPKQRFDPDEVTGRVGLTPTSAGRLGDPLGDPLVPGPKARKRIDHWSLRAGPRETDHVKNVLDELRELLEPSWAQLVRACAADELLVRVSCVIQLKSTFAPATRISASTLRWITDLGADLDVDVLTYALTSDNEGDPDAELKPFF